MRCITGTHPAAELAMEQRDIQGHAVQLELASDVLANIFRGASNPPATAARSPQWPLIHTATNLTTAMGDQSLFGRASDATATPDTPFLAPPMSAELVIAIQDFIEEPVFLACHIHVPEQALA